MVGPGSRCPELCWIRERAAHYGVWNKKVWKKVRITLTLTTHSHPAGLSILKDHGLVDSAFLSLASVRVKMLIDYHAALLV